jgi:hypothetical protein
MLRVDLQSRPIFGLGSDQIAFVVEEDTKVKVRAHVACGFPVPAFRCRSILTHTVASVIREAEAEASLNVPLARRFLPQSQHLVHLPLLALCQCAPGRLSPIYLAPND